MALGPTSRMKNLAARWLIDTVELADQSVTVGTRANMSDGTNTIGAGTAVRALVREPSVTDTDTPTADRAVRDLTIWVEESATPTAGMRCTITACGDSTLVAKFGTVLTVERDSLRAVRRLLVRLPNDG